MKKWLTMVIVLCGLVMLVQPVYANAELDVKISAGIDNKAKSGEPLPLTITIKNSGSNFAGDVVIDYVSGYQTGAGLALPVEIPAGEEKTYKVLLPDYSEEVTYITTSGKAPEMVTIYEGSWKDGKEVPFKGTNSITPSIVGFDSSVIGFIENNPDRLKAVNSINANGIPATVIKLDETNIPDMTGGLAILDTVLLDEYDLNLLSDEQQNVLFNWVNDGGELILGSNENTKNTTGIFSEYLPLNLSGEKVQSKNLGIFETGGAEKPSFDSFSYIDATATEGAEVEQVIDGKPVIASLPMGSGSIKQFAFPISTGDLTEWSGLDKWLSSAVAGSSMSNFNSMNYYPGQDEEQYSALREVNELFASFEFSSGFLVGVLVIYLILVVPVMFFVLKRKNKREHAWWLIPAVAVVMSAVVFIYGGYDRIGQPQVNEIGMYEVNPNGDLSGVYIQSLLSNTSGDYEVTYPTSEFSGRSFGMGTDMYMASSTNHKSSITSVQGEETITTMRDMPFWSTQSVYGEMTKRDVGTFAIELGVENDTLKGQITNNFPVDFKQLEIWTNSGVTKLDAIKAGETVTVDEPLKNPLLRAPSATSNGAWYMGNTQPGDSLETIRASVVTQGLKDYLLDKNGNDAPIVVGVTEQPLTDVKIKGKSVKSTSLSSVYQPFKPTTGFAGAFELKNTDAELGMTVQNGYLYEDPANSPSQISLDKGEYEWLWAVPGQISESNKTYKHLEINYKEESRVVASVYNNDSKDYEPLTETMEQTNEKEIQKYFNDKGQIKIKFNVTSDNFNSPLVKLPKITLEGEVKND